MWFVLRNIPCLISLYNSVQVNKSWQHRTQPFIHLVITIWSLVMDLINACFIFSFYILFIFLYHGSTNSPSVSIMHLSTDLNDSIVLWLPFTLDRAITMGLVLCFKSSSSSSNSALSVCACVWIILTNSWLILCVHNLSAKSSTSWIHYGLNASFSGWLSWLLHFLSSNNL